MSSYHSPEAVARRKVAAQHAVRRAALALTPLWADDMEAALSASGLSTAALIRLAREGEKRHSNLKAVLARRAWGTKASPA